MSLIDFIKKYNIQLQQDLNESHFYNKTNICSLCLINSINVECTPESCCCKNDLFYWLELLKIKNIWIEKSYLNYWEVKVLNNINSFEGNIPYVKTTHNYERIVKEIREEKEYTTYSEKAECYKGHFITDILELTLDGGSLIFEIQVEPVFENTICNTSYPMNIQWKFIKYGDDVSIEEQDSDTLLETAEIFLGNIKNCKILQETNYLWRDMCKYNGFTTKIEW